MILAEKRHQTRAAQQRWIVYKLTDSLVKLVIGEDVVLTGCQTKRKVTKVAVSRQAPASGLRSETGDDGAFAFAGIALLAEATAEVRALVDEGHCCPNKAIG